VNFKGVGCGAWSVERGASRCMFMLFANKVFEKKLIGVSSLTPTVKNNETLRKNDKIREQDMISKRTSKGQQNINQSLELGIH
jgi:hypothetical protein